MVNDQKNPIAVYFNLLKGIEQVKIPRRAGESGDMSTLSPKGLNLYFDLKIFVYFF